MAEVTKTRYRVLRPILHGIKQGNSKTASTLTLNAGDVVDLTDAEAGHLLGTQAIEIALGAIVDGEVVVVEPTA